MNQKRADYQRDMTACLDTRGYTAVIQGMKKAKKAAAEKKAEEAAPAAE